MSINVSSTVKRALRRNLGSLEELEQKILGVELRRVSLSSINWAESTKRVKDGPGEFVSSSVHDPGNVFLFTSELTLLLLLLGHAHLISGRYFHGGHSLTSKLNQHFHLTPWKSYHSFATSAEVPPRAPKDPVAGNSIRGCLSDNKQREKKKKGLLTPLTNENIRPRNLANWPENSSFVRRRRECWVGEVSNCSNWTSVAVSSFIKKCLGLLNYSKD